MKRNRMFLDKLGWPVVRIKGRPIVNFIRLILHARQYKYWEPPEWITKPNPNITTQRVETDETMA